MRPSTGLIKHRHVLAQFKSAGVGNGCRASLSCGRQPARPNMTCCLARQESQWETVRFEPKCFDSSDRRALTKMPSQEALVKSRVDESVRPSVWLLSTRGESVMVSVSVPTFPPTWPFLYVMLKDTLSACAALKAQALPG